MRSEPRLSSSITASRRRYGALLRVRMWSVHLAGALLPRRGETLLQANVETTRALVEAATSAGVKTFVYLSFPGADPASPNQYLRSKGMAEASHSAGRLCRCHLPGSDDPRAG